MSEPATEHIVVERPCRGVAQLTIDRARHFNTLSAATLDELGAAFESLSHEPSVGAIVLRGDGEETFAAGANIRELRELNSRSALGFSAVGQHVLNVIEGAPQIVYAAITGYCMGGGLDLALACDVRIASPNSVFAHPGARLGIITGFGGSSRLVRTVGKAAALEMFSSCRRVDANEALSLGLVDFVVEDPVRVALDRAASVAAADVVERESIKLGAISAWRRSGRGVRS